MVSIIIYVDSGISENASSCVYNHHLDADAGMLSFLFINNFGKSFPNFYNQRDLRFKNCFNFPITLNKDWSWIIKKLVTAVFHILVNF